MQEMIDIYDGQRRPVGIRLPRKSSLAPGQYMIYVLALIRDPQGRFLITRRALNKRWAAGLWEIPGGGVLAGETSLQAVLREVREETGLIISGCSPRLLYSYRNDDPNGDNYFADIYLCDLDFCRDEVKIQKEEVIGLALASPEQIRDIARTDGFLHERRIFRALENLA